MKTYKEVEFPHVPLSTEETTEVIKVLLAGNPVFRKWTNHFYSKTRGRQFRKDFFSGNLSLGGTCPLIPASDVARMNAVAAVESKLLLSHTHLIKRIVRGIQKQLGKSTYLEEWDLIQEGMIGLREAIYNYQEVPGKVLPKFITYAWKPVYRHILRSVSVNADMGGIKSTSVELKKRYFQVKREMEGSPKFSQVIEFGHFTQKEAIDLKGLLSRFSRASQITAMDDEISIDALAIDRNLTGIDQLIFDEAIEQEHLRREADIASRQILFEKANLTEVEQELLEAKFGFSEHQADSRTKSGIPWGSFTRIAKRRTSEGNHLSRQGARNILRRAEVKLGRVSEGHEDILTVSSDEVETIKKEPKVVPVETKEKPSGLSSRVKNVLSDNYQGRKNLNVPEEIVLAYVKRLVEGEPRRQLVKEMAANGYPFPMSTLWHKGEVYKRKLQGVS